MVLPRYAYRPAPGPRRVITFSPGQRSWIKRFLTLLLLGTCITLFYRWHTADTQIQSIQPPKPRIAIITFITNQNSYMQLSLKNKDHYARRHGYDFIIDYESQSSRGAMWTKFDMIERLTKSGLYDWIWWMDFDTLITNTDIKITDVIEHHLDRRLVPGYRDPVDIDFLLTHDCNGLNAGSFIVRAHPRSIAFLNRVRARYDQEVEGLTTWSYSEQDAMVDIMKEDDAYKHYALQVPQFELNAFPEEIPCYDEKSKKWENGAFVIHFAGAWAHVKGEDPTGRLMEKYKDFVIWGKWDQLEPRGW